MKLKIVISILIVCLLGGCTQSTKALQTGIDIPEGTFEALEAYIGQVMTDYEIPGMSVAVVHGSEIVYAKGFGVRQMGGTEPVDEHTLMMIGSASKSMTTMMMASLVDDGFFTWDTPVQDIWPDFELSDPALAKKMTMLHMVCNCSGLPFRNQEIAFNSNDVTAEDTMAWLSTAPIVGEFEKDYLYSNQTFASGGYIAALAAGGTYGNLYESYIELMLEKVFDPLGMTDTTLRFEDVFENGNYALPHVATLDYAYMPIDVVYEGWTKPIAPAAAVWSNAVDMGRYLITQMQDGVTPEGTRVISAENLDRTHQPKTKISGTEHYGLGWTIESINRLEVLNHPGGSAGFTTDMVFIPEWQVGIVVMVNELLMPQHTTVYPAVRYRLIELILEEEPAYDTFASNWVERNAQQWSVLRFQTSDSIDPESVSNVIGSYYNDLLGIVEIRLGDDGKLYFDSGEFFTELRPMKSQANRFMFASGTFIGKSMTIDAENGRFTLPEPMTGPEERFTFNRVEEN